MAVMDRFPALGPALNPGQSWDLSSANVVDRKLEELHEATLQRVEVR